MKFVLRYFDKNGEEQSGVVLQERSDAEDRLYVILTLKRCEDWPADCSQHLQGLEKADIVSEEEDNLVRVADCYVTNTMAISQSSWTKSEMPWLRGMKGVIAIRKAIQINGELRYLNDEEEHIFSARGELSEDEEEWRKMYFDRFNLSNAIYDMVKFAKVRKKYIKYYRKVTKVDINFTFTYYFDRSMHLRAIIPRRAYPC